MSLDKRQKKTFGTLLESARKAKRKGKLNAAKTYVLEANKIATEAGYHSWKDAVKAVLHEGTWSNPGTVEKANRLVELFRNPIPYKTAPDQLYHLMGDDDLFDRLEEEARLFPDHDARPFIATWLHDEWLKDLDETGQGYSREWFKPWDPQAIAILNELVQQWKY